MILDSAHNPASARILRETIINYFNVKRQKVILVLAMARDKEIDQVLEILWPLADIVIFTRVNNPRICDPIEFIEYIKDYDTARPIFLEPKPKKALMLAKVLATPKDLVLISGSFYLTGEVKRLLKNKRKKK